MEADTGFLPFFPLPSACRQASADIGAVWLPKWQEQKADHGVGVDLSEEARLEKLFKLLNSALMRMNVLLILKPFPKRTAEI